MAAYAGRMARIRLSRKVSIPEDEIEFRASRSGGPGGQGVNTTASKIELRFNVDASPSLTDAQKQRLRERLGNRITDDGVFILQASEERSQHRNRQAALSRFQALVGEAIQPPKRRKKTRPSRAAKRRRLEEKRHRGRIKELRKPPDAS